MDTLPRGDEIEIEQDIHMLLALELRLRSQDIQCGQDEERQVAIFLEGGEGKSATGE